MELCACPQCGLPAEVVTGADGVDGPARVGGSGFVGGELVGVRCIGRHWFFGLRERLVGATAA